MEGEGGQACREHSPCSGLAHTFLHFLMLCLQDSVSRVLLPTQASVCAAMALL